MFPFLFYSYGKLSTISLQMHSSHFEFLVFFDISCSVFGWSSFLMNGAISRTLTWRGFFFAARVFGLLPDFAGIIIPAIET